MARGRYLAGVDGLRRQPEIMIGRANSALGRIAELGSGVFEQGLTVGFSAGIGSRKIDVSFVLGGDSAPANVVLGPNTVGILDDPASYDETGFDTNVLDTDPTNNFEYYEERITTITDNLAEGNRDDFIESFLSQFRSVLQQWRKNNVAGSDVHTAVLIEVALKMVSGLTTMMHSPMYDSMPVTDKDLKDQFDLLQSQLTSIEARIGCPHCSIAMRPAGDAYVCESDGSTRFFDYKEVNAQDAFTQSDDGPSDGGPDGGKEGPADGDDEDNGGSGSREPRKPKPSAGPASAQKDVQQDGLIAKVRLELITASLDYLRLLRTSTFIGEVHDPTTFTQNNMSQPMRDLAKWLEGNRNNISDIAYTSLKVALEMFNAVDNNKTYNDVLVGLDTLICDFEAEVESLGTVDTVSHY